MFECWFRFSMLTYDAARRSTPRAGVGLCQASKRNINHAGSLRFVLVSPPLGRGRLGPLLLRGRRRAPVEPRELPVELMTTTAAPLTFCPFPKFHPPSLATHSVPASKISDCSDGSKLRHLHRGSTSSTRSTPRQTLVDVWISRLGPIQRPESRWYRYPYGMAYRP